MSEVNNNKSKWLHLRLSEAEQKKLQSYFSKTTCRKLSEYARKRLLDKPITTTYRNQSLDDLMTELSKLRTELNHIGNNFNQAVKRLHTLQQIVEFRTWLMSYELNRNILWGKIDEIKNHLQKLTEIWLQ